MRRSLPSEATPAAGIVLQGSVQAGRERPDSDIDLTVVVLDAEDRLDTTVIDDAYIQGVFERFADDQPGTGEPYGLGYREPNKV